MQTSSKFSSRRALLLGGAAIVSATAVGFDLSRTKPLSAADISGTRKPLAIPPLDRGEMLDGVRQFSLKVQDGETAFFADLVTKTRGINGNYLGPVLRFRKGETIRANVTNTLKESTTFHWHGFNLPAKADGGPHQIIKSGTTWSPEFKVLENASTMWFHAHMLGQTAQQVWQGLAGMVIIDDDNSDALNLPSTYGVDDIPVVLQDRLFDELGGMAYSSSMGSRMLGLQGDIPVVNGTVMPFLEVVSGLVRLRLLNGANASIYGLEFSDQREFRQIASDGGLLEAPVSMRHLRLAPGERAEIIVELSENETVFLKSVSIPDNYGLMTKMMGGQTPNFDILELRAKGKLSTSSDLPAKLTSLPTPVAPKAAKKRRFVLEMVGMGMMGGDSFAINGKPMDISVINNVVPKGQFEIWEIFNAGPMAHPFHVHNTQYRILDRSNIPPAANEAGLKDTVLVNPGETVRILVKFENYTDPARPYMYHCHILEHEDGGMMGQFTVV
ncbi:MAG: multicopper oxidase domain-containing protein [Alphaproteobacteria bacterium]|nr:multicopper oxidase domain-containing protein [Alphaproteobacteria bacterium]